MAQTLATPPGQTVPASTPKTKPAPTPAAKPKAAVANTAVTATPKQTPAPVVEAPETATPYVEAKLQRLISEREQLVLKYDYLKVQESSLWGNASKKDMIAVIDALKEVLKKDSEIIQAVGEQSLENRRASALRAAELQRETKRLNNQVQGDKRMVTDNIYDLKASLENAQNLIRRRGVQIKQLEEKVARVSDAKFEHDAIAAFFAMLSLVLVGYVVRLRGKISKAPVAASRYKKV